MKPADTPGQAQSKDFPDQSAAAKHAEKVVAENPRTPLPVLELLANELDRSIRQAVVGNPTSPWNILRRLSNDDSKLVSRDCSVDRQCKRYLAHALNSANESSTPSSVLLDLASKGYWSVRLAALNNTAMPPELRDRDLRVLWSDVEASLRATGSLAVSGAVELKDVATALSAMDLIPEPGDKKAIAAAAKSSDVLARLGALLSPGMQPGLLRMLLDDELEAVRNIAANRLRELEAA